MTACEMRFREPGCGERLSTHHQAHWLSQEMNPDCGAGLEEGSRGVRLGRLGEATWKKTGKGRKMRRGGPVFGVRR